MSENGVVRNGAGETALAEAVCGTARVRVRYAETDQMGVVYHANYLVWFEVGRVELMRQRGLDYKQMEIEENCGIAVVEATVRYKAPARYDDELTIETRVLRLRGPVVRFGYRIMRAQDGLLLCEGETVHVIVGRDMKRRPMPKKYAEILGAAASDTEVRHFGRSGSDDGSEEGSADHGREQGDWAGDGAPAR